MQLISVTNGHYRTEIRTLLLEYLSWATAEANKLMELQVDAQEMVAADMATLDRLLPPNGRFYLAYVKNELAGMGGLKRLGENASEIKRMYVREQMRSKGVGKAILDQLITDSIQLGCCKILLDSPIFSDKAHQLYQSRGFRYIEPYEGNENPKEWFEFMKFMRLDL